MKNLNVFQTVSDYNSAKTSGQLDLPNASLVNEDNSIHYEMDSQQDSLPEYVDLGLPSGLKWATCNLGASSFEQTGKYYSWGETTGYTTEQIENGDFGASEYNPNNNESLPPYDFTGDLDAKYDAATADRGGNWRIPTKANYEELLDSNNTTLEWFTSYNGVPGHIIKSKTNSNTIFLPAAGCAIRSSLGSSLAYMGDTDMYLTSTSEEYNKMFTLSMYYYYGDEIQSAGNYFYFEDMYERGNFGYPIRPVYVGE